MRYGILLLAALTCGSASAQVVNKCIGKGGATHYYSGPCPAGYQQAKTWDARPEPEPTYEQLQAREYQRQRAAAESAYLSRRAGTAGSGARGHHVRLDGAHNASRCDAAKASRESVLKAVGMARTYELLSRLDETVREACK